jgi:hypothetical protein
MSEPLIYDYEGAAARLGNPVSVDWLQRNKQRLPHCQFGKNVGFTEAHLFQIAELQTVLPGQLAAQDEQPTPLPRPAAKAVQSLKPRGARTRKPA